MVMKREFSLGVKLGSHQQDRMTVVALVLVLIGCILATDLRAQAYNDLVTYPGRPNYGALKFSSPQSWFNYLMLWQHQRDDQRSEELQQAFASKADMEKYIAAVRQKMRQLAGNFPERGDLHSRVVGTLEGDGFVVEKIVFESHPHHYVTAHLYLPVGSETRKFPACVEMCGHGLQGKGNGSGTAVQMARNGIAVLVVDPIGQGEMQQLIDGTGRNLTRGVTTEHTLLAPAYNLLGTSLEAQIFWDNSRAVDYLCTRKDIDAKHIGCYGFSGGGTEASYLLALDDRIQAASVGLFFSDRTRTLELQGPSDGCQWIPGEGALGINHADMALCMAPRPFQVLDGLFDFVDHYGALKGMKEVQRAYDVLGASECVEQYYAADGHACPPDAMEHLVGWMKRWLQGDTALPHIDEVSFRGKDMLCTSAGQVNLEFADAESTIQYAMRRYDELAKQREAFCAQPIEEIQKQMCRLLGLDESVLGQEPLPATLPGSALAKSVVPSGRTYGRDFEEYRFQLNREGEMPVAVVVRIPDCATAESPIELHLHERGKAWYLGDMEKLDMTSNGNIIVAADVRGVGEMEDPYIYNLTKYWNREWRCAVVALHEGRPLVGQRVVDVLTLVDFCSNNPLLSGRPLHMVGDGLFGPVLMHATVLDPRIQKVTLTHTLKSWKEYLSNPLQHDMQTNVIQGVLQYYDLPDLVRLAEGRVRVVD